MEMDRSLACNDTDDGGSARNAYGSNCAKIEANSRFWVSSCSGNTDDGDFTAAQMCCICGGGSDSIATPVPTPRCEDRMDAIYISPTGGLTYCPDSSDTEERLYHVCTSGVYSSCTFNASDDCCACGGGTWFQAPATETAAPTAYPTASGIPTATSIPTVSSPPSPAPSVSFQPTPVPTTCAPTEGNATSASGRGPIYSCADFDELISSITDAVGRAGFTSEVCEHGKFNDADFNAQQMCCVCDGGQFVNMPTGSPTHSPTNLAAQVVVVPQTLVLNAMKPYPATSNDVYIVTLDHRKVLGNITVVDTTLPNDAHWSIIVPQVATSDARCDFTFEVDGDAAMQVEVSVDTKELAPQAYSLSLDISTWTETAPLPAHSILEVELSVDAQMDPFKSPVVIDNVGPTLGQPWAGMHIWPKDVDGMNITTRPAEEYIMGSIQSVESARDIFSGCNARWDNTKTMYEADCRMPNTGLAGMWDLNLTFNIPTQNESESSLHKRAVFFTKRIRVNCPGGMFEDLPSKANDFKSVCADCVPGMICPEDDDPNDNDLTDSNRRLEVTVSQTWTGSRLTELELAPGHWRSGCPPL